MTAPPWVDDLFPFPTPAPFALVMDLAWQKATAEGYYDVCDPAPDGTGWNARGTV